MVRAVCVQLRSKGNEQRGCQTCLGNVDSAVGYQGKEFRNAESEAIWYVVLASYYRKDRREARVGRYLMMIVDIGLSASAIDIQKAVPLCALFPRIPR